MYVGESSANFITAVMQSKRGLRNFVFASIHKLKDCMFIYFIWAVMSDVACKNIKKQRYEGKNFCLENILEINSHMLFIGLNDKRKERKQKAPYAMI